MAAPIPNLKPFVIKGERVKCSNCGAPKYQDQRCEYCEEEKKPIKHRQGWDSRPRAPLKPVLVGE